jgi:hypothetical protein
MQMKCRKNVRHLSDSEKEDYVQAIIDLKNAPSLITAAQLAGATSRYDDYVWIHREVMGGAHTGPAFAPWHREFLKQFERDLQHVSGNPSIMIPYWDWTTARTSSDPGWPFTTNFMGGLGIGTDNRVMTGRFSEASGEWRLNIITGAGPTLPDGRPNPARDNTTYLRRLPSPPIMSNGQPLPLPTAPEAGNCLIRTAYDAVPWLEDPRTLTLAQVNASFRKFLEYLMHNGVHAWVGGNMMPMTSPNDPVFFLHHCNIDRLWAIWQQKHAPPITNYLPLAGNTTNHDIDDNMLLLDPSYFRWPVARRPMDVLDHRSLGFWYATDLPIITPVSISVNFGNVPEGLTTYKPVQFSVRTCQRIKFRITAISGTNFFIPSTQGDVNVDHSDEHDPVVGNVYIEYRALGAPSVVQSGSATIEAFISDIDGYFAASPGAEFRVGMWNINFTALPVQRRRSAVSLVLDRSGSMADGAGVVGGTKYDLLKSSLRVVADIMGENDAIGAVSFDDNYVGHTITTLMSITQMGTQTPPGLGRQRLVSASESSDLTPRGATAIGLGMIQGASQLNSERTNPATPYSHFAMVVMTDGNENVPPFVMDSSVRSAISAFSDNIYAIGLGRENNVSDSTLGSIARYMLITGDITTAEERFRLTKYFMQILARITGTAIVVDPQGYLMIGVEHKITFPITEADLSMQVITLSPLAPLLDFKLESPDGTIIDNSVSPNVSYQTNLDDAICRVNLPAVPSNPSGSHAGIWTATLSISKRKLPEILQELSDNLQNIDIQAVFEEIQKTGTLPYSFMVQSYSNIMMDVEVLQSNKNPGEELQLYSELTEYKVPIERRAVVNVEVTEPQGTMTYVPLKEYAPGKFKNSYFTSVQGIYQCRFKVIGYSLSGKEFQREETRSASVYKRIKDDGISTLDLGGIKEIIEQDRERFCKLISCIIDNNALAGFMDKLGIDPQVLIKCISQYCSMDKAARSEDQDDNDEEKRKINLEGTKHETARDFLMRTPDAEQLGIKNVQAPQKVEPHEEKRDPHKHMDFFPVFTVQNDHLQEVDVSQAIERTLQKTNKKSDHNDSDSKTGDHSHNHGSEIKKKKNTKHDSHAHRH